LKPEQAPADSAPAQSPWPWAEEAGDLFTSRNQHTPASSEKHDTPPSPGREALQALQAQAQANQPLPPPPRRWTFPLPPSLVTAGCVALAIVGGVVAALMVVFHTTRTPPQPSATSNPAVPTAAAVSPNPVTIPTPTAATPFPTGAPPGPNPAVDDTNTAAGAGPAPQPPHQMVTRRRAPAEHPAPAQPPETSAPQLNRPEWAGGDAQSTPDTSPCTDCAQSNLTSSPTRWSPDSP
jgi:hypothetical protein